MCWSPGAVDGAGEAAARACQCDHGPARLAWNCATCDVAAMDAEWTWYRPNETGVALLQLAFWPSQEVFCIRMRGGCRSGVDADRPEGGNVGSCAVAGDANADSSDGAVFHRGPLPRGVRNLFARCGRGEAALVGFSLFNDAQRLRLGHGLSLKGAGAADLQPALAPQGHMVSLRNAVWQRLRHDMDKGPRLSDWEIRLSHSQLRYAADDAWHTLRLLARLPTDYPPPACSRASWERHRMPHEKQMGWREVMAGG